MNKKIAAVIVTYNRKELLLKSIKSLLNQSYQVKKIIIIDNNSNDGTKEELIKHNLINNSIIFYKRLEENIGGAGGFYEGIKTLLEDKDMDYDYIALSDDDAIYDHKFFENIISFSEQKKINNIVAFTGTVVEHGKINFFHRRKLISDITLKQIPVEKEKYESESFELDIFSFVGCVINFKILKNVGLPCKEYFIWYDDTEYSLRVRKYGKIINVNNALIYHDTPVKSDKIKYQPNWKEYYGLRNSNHMILKHSNNRYLSNIYILFRTFKLILSSLINYRYKNFRIYRLRMIIDAYFSSINGRLGFNKKYCP